MLRPLTSFVVATTLAAVVGVSLGPAAPASASLPARETGARTSTEFNTDLTLDVRFCEDCIITVFSANGVDPDYASEPSPVVDGQVTFTLPSARTAGMSVRVEPLWAETPADTYVVWRYAGTQIGDELPLREARLKTRASGCWAGTVNEAVTLTIKVRRVSYFGRPTAIAWAAATESFVKPMKRASFGVLARLDAPTCDLDG